MHIVHSPMVLNAAQKSAVETIDQHILVLAGAGSGKTRVITAKVLYLMTQKQVHPQEILAVTFTNKAAGEMQKRVNQQVDIFYANQAKPYVPIKTFHSFGSLLLRRYIHHLPGYNHSFTIIDQNDIYQILKKTSPRTKNI